MDIPTPLRRTDAPRDPVIGQLARMMQRQQFSRRSLLGLGAGAAASALAACAPPLPPSSGATSLTLPTDQSAAQKTIYFANWSGYMDISEKDNSSHPTLDAFTKRTGIKVTYNEDIDDNNTYYNKVAPILQARSEFAADIFVFTDWMANRVIRNNYCQPLELIQMPHASNLLPSLREVSWDPGRLHSLTYTGGFAGLGWNKTVLKRDLKSLDDLWAPDLKGRIVVLSEMRDTAGLIMMQQGARVDGQFTDAQITNAMDEVSKRISDGWIRKVQGNAYLQELKSGNALAGIVWSGDMFTLQFSQPEVNWQFGLAESGATLWTDNMMVPITSTHRSNAEKLMDYYYEPAVAAQLAAFINYICPVSGAQQEMEKIDPKLAENWMIFPSDSFMKQHNVEGFRALTPDEEQKYSAQWATVIGN